MKKWVVANWKMNGSADLLNQYQAVFKQSENLIVCPPAVYLSKATNLVLGAQNIHHHPKGAYTGEISALMLNDIGIKYCIVGHSERRQYFGDTDELVRTKAELCIENSITPIICIGETLEQYKAGKTLEVLEKQLSACLPRAENFWIAYEPIWAIGTGLTPTKAEILITHAFLREKLPPTMLLYGGSVNENNATEILGIPNVDGVLVGGASLDIEKISQVTQSAMAFN